MSPLEREVKELRELVMRILRVEDVAFIESLRRRVLQDADVDDLPAIRLNDLSDVNTTGVSNGQVIKYNSSNQTWEDADDDIGAS